MMDVVGSFPVFVRTVCQRASDATRAREDNKPTCLERRCVLLRGSGAQCVAIFVPG